MPPPEAKPGAPKPAIDFDAIFALLTPKFKELTREFSREIGQGRSVEQYLEFSHSKVESMVEMLRSFVTPKPETKAGPKP